MKRKEKKKKEHKEEIIGCIPLKDLKISAINS
jgi:hypothetical protein